MSRGTFYKDEDSGLLKAAAPHRSGISLYSPDKDVFRSNNTKVHTYLVYYWNNALPACTRPIFYQEWAFAVKVHLRINTHVSQAFGRGKNIVYAPGSI
jgi:hypothetical protein